MASPGPSHYSSNKAGRSNGGEISFRPDGSTTTRTRSSVKKTVTEPPQFSWTSQLLDSDLNFHVVRAAVSGARSAAGAGGDHKLVEFLCDKCGNVAAANPPPPPRDKRP